MQVGQSRLKQVVNEGDVYVFLAVLFMSHLHNPSTSATRNLFVEMSFHPSGESLRQTITSALCAFYPSL